MIRLNLTHPITLTYFKACNQAVKGYVGKRYKV